jgi:hypothetical protein
LIRWSWAILAMLACFAAVSTALSGCNPQPPKASPTPSVRASTTPTPLALHITGQGTAKQPVRVLWSRHNHIDAQIIASSFESKGPEARTHAVFHDAHATFHGRKGEQLQATAPQAILDQTTNQITLLDGVHARSATGMTLECTQLVYDRTSQMLDGTGNVVVTDPKGFRATGSSFTSDISLTHVKMK